MKVSFTILFLFITNTFVASCDIPSGVLTTFYTVSATVYNPEASQCDDSPLITADGGKINEAKANEQRWVAVSRDLLKVF